MLKKLKQKSLHWQQTTTWEADRVRQLLSEEMLKHDIAVKKQLKSSPKALLK